METRLLDQPAPDAATIATGCADGRWEVDALDQAVAVFVSVRPRLLGKAHRILGTVTEAEDVVQEAWLRWQATDRTIVIDPLAFLVATTIRLALNQAQCARRRHETYVGPWLPEPVETSVGPQSSVERGEEVEQAFLLLLEKLTPMERAAFVLREAFGYPYRRISEILQRAEPNTRQLVRRARCRITTGQPTPVSPASHQRLVHAFLAAARAGELADLEKLLAPA